MYELNTKVPLLAGVLVLVSAIIGCEHQKSGRQASQDTNIREDANIRTLSKSAMNFKPDEFEIAAKAYASGDLKGARGVVQLPHDLAGVTIDGRMYVTQAPVSDNLYLFITWRGKGSNLRGYICRLANAHDSPDMNVDRIDVLGPTIWEPGFGKIEVEIESTLVPGWYKAKRDMD